MTPDEVVDNLNKYNTAALLWNQNNALLRMVSDDNPKKAKLAADQEYAAQLVLGLLDLVWPEIPEHIKKAIGMYPVVYEGDTKKVISFGIMAPDSSQHLAGYSIYRPNPKTAN